MKIRASFTGSAGGSPALNAQRSNRGAAIMAALQLFNRARQPIRLPLFLRKEGSFVRSRRFAPPPENINFY
jgi:hypothetical protein